MTKFLQAAELPYVLALVIGAAGWTSIRIIDRIISSPTLAYGTSVQRKAGSQEFVAQVCNVTRDRGFTGLQFVVRAPDATKLLAGAAVRPVRQAYERSDATGDDRAKTYLIANLQPGMCMDLVAPFEGRDLPTLHLERSKDAVRLTEQDLEVLFARNEMLVLVVLLLLYVGVVSYWAMHYKVLENRK